MKAILFSLSALLVVSLQGCTNSPFVNPPKEEAVGSSWQLPPPLPHSYRTHKTIDDYAEQIAMQLVENLRFANPDDTIAVTSFVELNSALNQTNLIGNHLSDSLMGELQQFGMAVLDFKVTDFIVVNNKGDFSFSRDHSDLRELHDIDYILSGTMTRNVRGIHVHARIVGMKSKVVVASAKVLIPNFVIHSIYSPEYMDGIRYGS